MNDSAAAPNSLAEIRELIAETRRLIAVGNRTKPTLSQCDATTWVSTRKLSGITAYEPSEYTITARAGTRIDEISATLAQHQQYLPCDPMLAVSGATIGGTVASGLSGSGRFRYGGVRDFLLHVEFLRGDGQLVRAGGKVVKNSAGFDLPKFLVGSMGRFGFLTELTLKVFPCPAECQSVFVQCSSHTEAIERMSAAAAARWELDAVDYRWDDLQLALRLRGPSGSCAALIDSIQQQWPHQVRLIEQPAEYWNSIAELNWSGDLPVCVKIPTTLASSLAIQTSIADLETSIHSSAAGNVMWILAADDAIDALDAALAAADVRGLVVRGGGCGQSPRVGKWTRFDISSAVKAALDPTNKFPPE